MRRVYAPPTTFACGAASSSSESSLNRLSHGCCSIELLLLRIAAPQQRCGACALVCVMDACSQSFIKEQQTVMKEAHAAPSLVECRHILYHESLRHVPTAATHGRGGAGGQSTCKGASPSRASLGSTHSMWASDSSVVDGLAPIAPPIGFPRGAPSPARLRLSVEKEMLTRLQKVMHMNEGPAPSVRSVAHAWSSSLRSS
jgi:hypothetical protein